MHRRRGLRASYLRHDPTKGVELPTSHKRRIVPPTKEQVRRLIDCAREIGGNAYGIVYVDALTGLRRNEVLALHFSDIDWMNKELLVTRAVKNQVLLCHGVVAVGAARFFVKPGVPI